MRAKHRGICSTNTSPLFCLDHIWQCWGGCAFEIDILKMKSREFLPKCGFVFLATTIKILWQTLYDLFSCACCNCNCWRGNIFTTRIFIMCIWPFPKRFWHNLFQTNHNTPLYITIQKVRMGLTTRRWIQNTDLSNSLQHWMNGPQHLVKFGILPILNVLKLSRTLGYISLPC